MPVHAARQQEPPAGLDGPVTGAHGLVGIGRDARHHPGLDHHRAVRVESPAVEQGAVLDEQATFHASTTVTGDVPGRACAHGGD